MKFLLLTLGHNSSAIYIEKGKILWGYETERLTGVKSDSRFPMPFVDKYLLESGLPPCRPDMVYVTHWAPDGLLRSMSAKHWDPSYFDGVPIRTLSASVTHHDTHMSAARCYAGDTFPLDKTYGFVVDGFGTFGEHFSVYEIKRGSQKLVQRVHGYGTSLGLWYQYATAFMGMKMHEDEYKLLGYEVHVPAIHVAALASDAVAHASKWVVQMDKSVYGSKYDPLYSLDALSLTKDGVYSHLTSVCRKYGISNPSHPEARAILAHYVQAVLENVVLTIIRDYKPHNVILSGGVFYNVKLNKLIVDEIRGQTCVYPLAGDQGNAIGLYYLDHPNFLFPSTLNWGLRRLRDVGHVPGLLVCDEHQALGAVCSRLEGVGYVNLVRGNMEFGPRAMCNTSTLAMPNLETVERINSANERNTVMPMAPVMTFEMYKALFDNWQRVWKSFYHMVVAMEYAEHPMSEMLGVAHEYWYPHHHHTGRPQVARHDDEWLIKVLRYMGHPLINTSFNFHGMPIALGMESIIKNHMMQYQRDNSFTTVVIQNDI